MSVQTSAATSPSEERTCATQGAWTQQRAEGEVHGLREPEVRGDDVPDANADDIARHDFPRRHASGLSVPNHAHGSFLSLIHI